MSYEFTTREGQRVEVHVAADYDRMNAAFQQAFPGIALRINRGSVTYEEQKAVFLSRYVTAGNVRGRKVYDTRWWEGQLWYRISSAGTVAQPKTSNHEIDGPNGPRSIDISDTGSTAGVSVRGSVRDRWMEQHAGEFEFENEGYKFNETWHKTNRGSLVEAPPQPQPPQSAFKPQDMLGWNWHGIADMLRGTGRYRGNDVPGPNMITGFQDFLNDWGYSRKVFGRDIREDGDFGRESCMAAQQWLKDKYGYSGSIDAQPGPGTHVAWNKAEAANNAAF